MKLTLPSLAVALTVCTAGFAQTTDSGTLDRQATRSNGNSSKSAIYTNAAGQQSTHKANKSYNATTGAYSGSGSTTLANGQTAGHNVSSVKTATGRQTTATATGPNGKSATLDSATTTTGTGTARTTTASGPDGASATNQATVSRSDGTTSRTSSTSVTPPKA